MSEKSIGTLYKDNALNSVFYTGGAIAGGAQNGYTSTRNLIGDSWFPTTVSAVFGGGLGLGAGAVVGLFASLAGVTVSPLFGIDLNDKTGATDNGYRFMARNTD